MKFTAYVRPHNLPITYWDARAAGISGSGSPYTLTAQALSNGGTRFYFQQANPPFPPIETGDHFIITHAPGVSSLTYAGGLVSTSAEQGGWDYFEIGVSLGQLPPDGTQYIRVRQAENASVAFDNVLIIDLRKHIDNMVFTSNIEYGYDTATITLNNSASTLGKNFNAILGGNIEIADEIGTICWSGIVTNIYLDGDGGRIDALGYKHTFEWFRFDNAYLRTDGLWPADGGTEYWPTGYGPTTVDVMLDATRANPYINKTYINAINIQDGSGNDFRSAQLAGTANNGLDELDFSDGSYKAMDAIRTAESFGFYGADAGGFGGQSSQFSDDTVYLQCWRNGLAKIQRVINDPAVFNPDVIIPRSAVSKNYAGVEISGDISEVVSEQYLVYNDEVSGEKIISASSYNLALIDRYGIRTKVTASSQPTPELAAIVASVARSDHALVTGIGNVRVIGNLRGGGGNINKEGGGQQKNILPYTVHAGMTVQFEENLGYSSLYRNRTGIPGIFYIGSTSYDTSTNILTISPARIMSAVDLLVTRLSDIQN